MLYSCTYMATVAVKGLLIIVCNRHNDDNDTRRMVPMADVICAITPACLLVIHGRQSAAGR